MSKRVNHLQDIGRQSLDKFIRLVDKKGNLNEIELVKIKNDWNNFLNDEKRIAKYDKCIKNFESLIGFGSKLSKKLSIERLTSRVAEHFAEVDLAEHIIRDYSLEKQNNNQLEKLIEKVNTGKICDFQLHLSQGVICFEAKYTSSISENSIKTKIKNALLQILKTDKNVQLGVVWIFTYQFPANPQNFQTLIENIKVEFQKTSHLSCLLNIQIYSKGLFGDCAVMQVN